MPQTAPGGSTDGDKVGYRSEPAAELELIAVGCRTHCNAGGSDVSLPSLSIGRAESPPVEHPAIDGGQRLPGEDQLVSGGVIGATEVEDALYQSVIVQITTAISVVPRAE